MSRLATTAAILIARGAPKTRYWSMGVAHFSNGREVLNGGDDSQAAQCSSPTEREAPMTAKRTSSMSDGEPDDGRPKKFNNSASSEETQKRRRRGAPEQYLFKPGQSGNPAGPKAGYRHEFSRAFVGCVSQDFAEHGPKVVERVRKENPLGYLRICASLVDQEVNVKTPFSHLDHLTDDQLRASIAELNERVLQALAGAKGDGAGAKPEAGPQPAGKLETIQ
jgi:hypothetical protein